MMLSPSEVRIDLHMLCSPMLEVQRVGVVFLGLDQNRSHDCCDGSENIFTLVRDPDVDARLGSLTGIESMEKNWDPDLTCGWDMSIMAPGEPEDQIEGEITGPGVGGAPE